MSRIESLDDLNTALRQQLTAQSNFHFVNTRLILQTGINLKKIKPEQNQDPVLVARVLEALSRMGVALQGGTA